MASLNLHAVVNIDGYLSTIVTIMFHIKQSTSSQEGKRRLVIRKVCIILKRCLKLDLYDKNNMQKKKNKDNNLVPNQYTLSHFSHSDWGFSSVKTYANKRTLLEEKKWRKVGWHQ